MAVPKDVQRELFALFMIIDENQSHYLQHNIDTYAGDPKSVKKLELVPEDADGNADLTMGHGFAIINHKFTINGYMFGNNPPIQIHKGEHARWYLMTIGRSLQLSHSALARQRRNRGQAPHRHSLARPGAVRGGRHGPR
jgi:manganese oxidase